MATEIKVPNLGDNVDSGEVIAVLVKAGDTIEKDTPLLELETGKATIEVPADIAGRITEVRVQEGTSVTPGQVIFNIEAAAADAAPAEEAEEPAPPTRTEHKTEKTAPPESTPESPPEPPKSKSKPPPPPATDESAPQRVPVAAAPSIRKLAREIGVSIQDVEGTGPGGRIQVDDVKTHAKRLLTQGGRAADGSPPGSGRAAPELPDFSKWGEVKSVPMNGVRKMTARHMAMCWNTIPHVTQQEKADITELERVRKLYAKRAESLGGKLTLTAMLLKIVASALKVYPQFNASVDMNKNAIIVKQYIHIGVAVDTPKGLMVPVVRDVDQKNMLELAVELSAIAAKARDGKIGADDLQGGTFTISNLGGIGGSFFTPIINHPEVAILGVGRGTFEPVLCEDKFEGRLMLPLALSYDHRVIDGADGARFITWIAQAMEQPVLMALEG